jgi:hypothetical protein
MLTKCAFKAGTVDIWQGCIWVFLDLIVDDVKVDVTVADM